LTSTSTAFCTPLGPSMGPPQSPRLLMATERKERKEHQSLNQSLVSLSLCLRCSPLSWQQPKSTGELLYKPRHVIPAATTVPQPIHMNIISSEALPFYSAKTNVLNKHLQDGARERKKKGRGLSKHLYIITQLLRRRWYKIYSSSTVRQVAKATPIPRTARRTRPHATPSTPAALWSREK
jgi:hypothetical protein